MIISVRITGTVRQTALAELCPTTSVDWIWIRYTMLHM